MTFVPAGFDPPRRLETERFVLEPLGPQHNEADYDAWGSSIDHIRATPGFEGRSWPREMTLEENRGDLERHARDFEERTGFTFTVLDAADDDVIGCVYLYPADDGTHDVQASSWVRASHAGLDVALWETVTDWLAAAWPWTHPSYAPRART
jgi:RimJ/RimL family protein N-acetyltransferase